LLHVRIIKQIFETKKNSHKEDTTLSDISDAMQLLNITFNTNKMSTKELNESLNFMRNYLNRYDKEDMNIVMHKMKHYVKKHKYIVK